MLDPDATRIDACVVRRTSAQRKPPSLALRRRSEGRRGRGPRAGWVLGPIDALTGGRRAIRAGWTRGRARCRRSATASGCRRGGKAFRWARRITGLIATAAFLGAGVAIAHDDPARGDGQEVAASPALATPTADAEAPRRRRPRRRRASRRARPRRSSRRARTRSRSCAPKGYTTLKQSDYDPKATLRVLIGRPVGDSAGGHRAFFFNKDVSSATTRPARRPS